MAEMDYLNKILETESIAERIEFTARSERKENISIARDEAQEILIKAKSDADADYKETIARVKENGIIRLQSDKEKALAEAENLRSLAGENIEDTIRKVAERIVSRCADN